MDAIRSKALRTDVVAAYSHCPRKAFLLHCTKERGTPHEYLEMLEECANVSRTRCVAVLHHQTRHRSVRMPAMPFHPGVRCSRKQTSRREDLKRTVTY